LSVLYSNVYLLVPQAGNDIINKWQDHKAVRI